MKQKKENEMNEIDKNQICGVFWIVEGKLLAVPYDEEEAEGLSKNGFSYNHRLLWPRACPEGCRKRYDYYPRGRVEYTDYGKPVILIGHSVEKKYIPEIIEAYEIRENSTISNAKRRILFLATVRMLSSLLRSSAPEIIISIGTEAA